MKWMELEHVHAFSTQDHASCEVGKAEKRKGRRKTDNVEKLNHIVSPVLNFSTSLLTLNRCVVRCFLWDFFSYGFSHHYNRPLLDSSFLLLHWKRATARKSRMSHCAAEFQAFSADQLFTKSPGLKVETQTKVRGRQ